LVGLFSLLDAMLDAPLDKIVNSLSLPAEVVAALTSDKPSPLKHILSTVSYYEKGSWYNTKRNAQRINVDYEELADYYQNALVWARKYNDDPVTDFE
jgi:EAL and modified HD-GYP domain-containing signal transduction protein